MYTTIYTKYSNERDPRLAIRTDILEDENGNRVVRKLPEYPEGETHVAALYHWYQVLSARLSAPSCETEAGGQLQPASGENNQNGDDADSGLNHNPLTDAVSGLIPGVSSLTYNRCRPIPDGVELEYISGESLEDHLLSVLRTSGADECADEFLQYLQFVRALHTGAVFTPCEAFENVFGHVSLPTGTVCAPCTNIDLLCENIYLSKCADPNSSSPKCTVQSGSFSECGHPESVVSEHVAQEKTISESVLSEGIPSGSVSESASESVPSERIATVIDYEWSFDFPIPVNFLLYRIIFYFTAHAYRGEEFARFDFPGKMGISKEEIAAYEEMETHFQHYVTGRHVPVRDLYDDISDGYVRPVESFLREELQVYFDYGKGLSEEDSILCRMKYDDCWHIQTEITIPEGVQSLRVDPGYHAAMVHLTGLRFDNQAERPPFALREGVIRGDWLYFTEDDPNIQIPSIPRGAKTLLIELEVHKLDAAALSEVGRMAGTYAARKNPLGKIKESAKSLLK